MRDQIDFDEVIKVAGQAIGRADEWRAAVEARGGAAAEADRDDFDWPIYARLESLNALLVPWECGRGSNRDRRKLESDEPALFAAAVAFREDFRGTLRDFQSPGIVETDGRKRSPRPWEALEPLRGAAKALRAAVEGPAAAVEGPAAGGTPPHQLPPIEASQAAIKRAVEGDRSRSARYVEGLRDQGTISLCERVPTRKNRWRVWFANPAQHEEIRRKIAEM